MLMEKKEMSLEEAMTIIREVSTRYNRVTIYKQCYVFYYDDGSELIKDGGFGAPKGVIKDSGKVMTMARLVAKGVVNREEKIVEGQIIDLMYDKKQENKEKER